MIPGWLVDLPDWLVDGSQVFGAFVGTIALVLAVVAMYRAETVAARERRIAHELEVLRSMTDIRLRRDGKLQTNQVQDLLAEMIKLRDPRDFPITKVALGLSPSRKDIEKFVERYPHAPNLGEGWFKDRFLPIVEDGTYALEWEAVMERHLLSRRRWWRRQPKLLHSDELDRYEAELRARAR